MPNKTFSPLTTIEYALALQLTCQFGSLVGNIQFDIRYSEIPLEEEYRKLLAKLRTHNALLRKLDTLLASQPQHKSLVQLLGSLPLERPVYLSEKKALAGQCLIASMTLSFYCLTLHETNVWTEMKGEADERNASTGGPVWLTPQEIYYA